MPSTFSALYIMKNVTILGFDYAFATSIIGMADLLGSVGVTWNYIHGQPLERQFKVDIVSPTGKDIPCANNISIHAHKPMSAVKSSDLLIIPTIAGDIDQTLARNQAAVAWIKEIAETGCDIACNCTGAFLLAEAGLLDGRVATTHWGFTRKFEERFPQVKLKSQELITEDGPIFCSGGGTAWFDMSLFLIERYCGYEVAQASTKSYVFDVERNSYSSEMRIPGKRYHQDKPIAQLQDYLDKHFDKKWSIQRFCEQTNLSERTLKRRFKQATGDTPIAYLQSLRIEAAKRLLEGTRLPIEEITHKVGYEDVSSFIRLFKRNTGYSPGSYRARFARRINIT